VVASTLLIVGGEERVYAWHYSGGNRIGVCFLVSPSAGSDERWEGANG
jgi:hypothetical protein